MTDPWSSEDMERIEQTLEQATRRLDAHGELIAELRTGQVALSRNIERIGLSFERFLGNFDRLLPLIEQMQADIHGLQSEQRRLRAHLSGENPLPVPPADQEP